MVSRRNLLAGGLAAASLKPAAACPAARRLFIPGPRDRERMMDKASQFRAAYNAGRAGPFLGPEPILTLHMKPINQPAAVLKTLAELRTLRGRMLTPVTDANSMFLPEDAKIFFVSSMELIPDDEALDRAFTCAAPGSHDSMMVALRWMVDQRTNRIAFDRYPTLAIGWPSV